MNILNRIVKEKIPCFFISPHLDDAILSCGGLIDYLKNKTRVEVITVFTEISSPPYTHFAKKYMQICGFQDEYKYFNERRAEDIKLMRSLNVSFRHLGFIDAVYRKKRDVRSSFQLLNKLVPEIIHLYPFNSSIGSGKIAKDDIKLMQNIKNSLKLQKEKFMVFCPLAIGNHVDHLIVKEICDDLFSNIVYWTDYPYILWGNTAKDFIKQKRLTYFEWNQGLDQKHELILQYKTQIQALFPKKIPNLPSEVYYNK